MFPLISLDEAKGYTIESVGLFLFSGSEIGFVYVILISQHGVNFWIQGVKNEVVFFTIPMANMVPKTAMYDGEDIRKLSHHKPALSLLARHVLLNIFGDAFWRTN